MNLDEKARADIREHVLSCAPQEACGLIAAGAYVPCRNIAKDPKNDFLVDPEDQLRAGKLGAIEAVIHSHVNQRIKSLSKNDMTGQQEMKIPWGVVFVKSGLCSDPVFFGDQVDPAPLEGREFIHGIFDCWTLVRDWFRVKKVATLPNPPRGWGWWEEKEGKNLYFEGIALGAPGWNNHPFEDARDLQALKEGDILFASIRSERINHAAIYLGDGRILHHLVGTCSRVEPLGESVKHIRHICRHEGVA